MKSAGNLLKLLFYTLWRTKVHKGWTRVVHAENNNIVEKWYRKLWTSDKLWTDIVLIIYHCDTKNVSFLFYPFFTQMKIPSKYHILTTWSPLII
jgi:hypothetical protein